MLVFYKLTRPALKKLDSRQRVTEHGITFERLPSGDGVYSVNIMVNRVRVHRVIGRESDGTTRTQCETFIESTRTAAREDRLALPKGRKIALVFRDAAAQYIARLKDSDGNGIQRKECQLRLHLTPFFGSMSLSKIGNFEVARYKKHRREAGASDATCNRELAVLSHIFSKAVEWGWLTHRPAKIDRYSEDRGRIEYLTPDQCQKVLEAAKADISPHIYPFCRIALSTSMRMTEVLSIERANVDLEKRRIWIPKAKSGRREQPISGELAGFLDRHMQGLPSGTPWLFPSIASKSGRLATIRKAHRRVVTAAGLDPDKVVRHTFRHTAVTHLVQSGVDLPTVQKISGHKTLAMVTRYAHANGAHLDSAMEKLEGRLTAGAAAPVIGAITPELHWMPAAQATTQS